MPSSIKKLKNKIIHPHELREINEILIKHHGLNEGLFELGIEFQFAIGPIGFEPNKSMPGGIFGVKSIGLVKTDKIGPNTVDAADINPVVSLKKRIKKPNEE